MDHTFPVGPVRIINARNVKVVTGLMKTFHPLYIKNSRYADYLDGEIHAINEDEAKKVGATHMLNAKDGELYAIVPFFYYTRRPSLAYFVHSVPKKYKTLLFVCNYSRGIENPKALQANFLFCEAEAFKKAFKELTNVFKTITNMEPAYKKDCIFLPFDAITAVFAIYENMELDVPEPLRYCEYAYWEMKNTKIQDVILFLEV